MKRNVDLMRQLLLDIESRGPDCCISVLRKESAQDVDETVHYHLRLLIDGGWLKEVDRTSSGSPCVRLTNDGQEFIEATRSEARWREAKWIVRHQTGGLSLRVLLAVLTRWSIDASLSPGSFRGHRGYYGTPYSPYELPTYRPEPYVYERRDPVTDEALHRPYYPVRPDWRDYREHFDVRDRYEFRDRYGDRNGYSYDRFFADLPGASLPADLV